MKTQTKADLAILSITLVWGSSFALMKDVLDFLPLFAYLTLRFLVASITLSIIFYKHLNKINKKAIFYGGIIGLFLFGGMALQVAGLQFTSASNSAFITGLNVVMVPIFSVIILKMKPPVPAVIGVALATLGLFILSGGISLNINIGDVLTLFCAVCFALQIIYIDRFNKIVSPIIIAIIQIWTATFLYSILWALDRSPIHMTPRVIFTIIFTGAIGTAFAFATQTIAQKYTTPTRTALIITCEPVFGAIFAVLIPNSSGVTEVLGITTIIGCLLILIGMLTTELGQTLFDKIKSDKKTVIRELGDEQ